MDLDKELHNLIKLVSNVTDAHTASLFWLSADEKELYLRSSHSLSKNLIHEVRIPVGSTLIGLVAQQGKSVNASPFKNDPKTLQLYSKEENIKSFLAVPVKISRHTRGVLCVDSKKSFFFTSKVEKILNGFAGYIAQVIQRDAEYQVIKDQANGYLQLYSLYKGLSGFHKENIFDLLISISRQLFGFDLCLLCTFDAGNRELTVRLLEGADASSRVMQRTFSAGEGIASLVLRTQKPLLLTDLDGRKTQFFIFAQDEPFKNISCFMGVPLLVNDEAIGFLGFTSREPRAFGERDLQLASVLSFQASSAISLSRAHEQIRRKDKIDSLTGLATHSLLHCELEQVIQQADKQAPFALLLLDLDGFKQVNKKYSYQVGDELLKKVAQILLRLIRDNDLVVRFAGEEFCILLKNSPRTRANHVAERIRKVIQQTVFVVQGREIKLTVSIGLASYLEDAISKEELLGCVKSALGAAKQKRNCVCSFKDLPAG